MITEASNDGKQCEKGRMHVRPCEILPCPVPVNCELSNWNKWSTCSKTCGKGKQTRRRTVITEASNGGRQCRQGRVEDRPCQILSCPPECQLSEWSNWSTCTCSKASGTGKQTRWKTDISNCRFVNREFEDRQCNKFPCTQSCIEKHNQFLCWNTVFDLQNQGVHTVFDLQNQGVHKTRKEECAKLCYSHSTCEGWSYNGHKVSPLNLMKYRDAMHPWIPFAISSSLSLMLSLICISRSPTSNFQIALCLPQQAVYYIQSELQNGCGEQESVEKVNPDMQAMLDDVSNGECHARLVFMFSHTFCRSWWVKATAA